MGVSNNTILLQGCMQGFRENNELSMSDDDVFELFTLSLITRKMDLSFEELQNCVVDGGMDGGIDTFLISADDHIFQNMEDVESFVFSPTVQLKMFLGQAKNKTNFEEVGLDKIISSLFYILNLEMTEDQLLERFNPQLTEKIKIFHLCWEHAVSKNCNIDVNFYFATRANEKKLKGTFQHKIDQICASVTKNIYKANVTFNTYSAQELLSLYQTPKETSFELTFKEAPSSIEYSRDRLGYIGVVKLGDFYTFLKDEEGSLRENIFENNIRHYQGNVDVNSKIQKSISEELDKDFWWLNNGVTIIASSVRPSGRRLVIDNPQIVNGLQTSFSIYHTYKESTEDNRSLLVKIIETNDKETIDKIISSTNSQNPVSTILLRATEDFQRNIELYFLTKGYYYDRRKNYYKNSSKPASKIFSIQSTAQAIESIKRWSPNTARSNPTTIIKTDASYDAIFDKNVDLSVYLNCCILVQVIQSFINQKIDNDLKSTVRNFTYHIARTLTSYLTSKSYYQASDIANLNLENIDEVTIINATGFVTKLVTEYQDTYKGKNIINISKEKGFADFLSKKLVKIFGQ